MKTESQRIGHYELLQRLSQDSAGETWQAYDSSLQRIVILKLYRTDLLDVADPLTAYLDEVEQIASLHHPNIARIYDIQVLAPGQVGNLAGLICMALEYVEGETLADYIKSTIATGKMPAPADVVQLFSTLALAIDSAHQRGIVHGNLKPTNILLGLFPTRPGRVGTPVLTDFAKTKFSIKRPGNTSSFSYLAPEQVKGCPAGESSDIYALGVLLYELYTGVTPFRGNRPIAVMMQHINAQPTPPDLVNPGISSALTQVILTCLAKDSEGRFPNATSLAFALAEALHVPVSEELRRFSFTQDNIITSVIPPVVDAPNVVKEGDQSASPAGRSQPQVTRSRRRRYLTRYLVAMPLVAFLLILGASIGAAKVLQQNPSAGIAGAQGHAFFLNSGQINANTTQGINDELQIDISNMSDPAAGKSYYAWLLGDVNQTEASPLLLGRLTVVHGNVHFLYTGDSRHTNLLAFASRFLINEDNARNPAGDPLLEQDTWRYYVVIPQTPDPKDSLHFSMLDHLRHLLVESPELAIRGLHGGLSFWFAKDTSTVANMANGLSGDWQNKDANRIHDQVVRILDYLDGPAHVGPDVPAGTPFLADAQTSQVALLGPAPQDAYAPGYVFQNEPPPGYVYLLQTHLNGALLAPQATPEQHQLAVQISAGIDTVRATLTQVYHDALQLVRMTNTQLLQDSSLVLLNDLTTQVQYAYTGQPDPSTGVSQSGALWIYNNLQRLATFTVVPYQAPKA